MFHHLCLGSLQSHRIRGPHGPGVQSRPISQSHGVRPVAARAREVLLHDLSDRLTPYSEARPDGAYSQKIGRSSYLKSKVKPRSRRPGRCRSS